jgi:hypothetical protein
MGRGKSNHIVSTHVKIAMCPLYNSYMLIKLDI